MDTAETPPAENEPEEWFGIPDDADEHLYEWGENATEFSLELMAPEDAEAGDTDIEGRHVKMTFDENEPLRGNYGRLLTHMYYDPDEFAADFATDSFSRNYNRETIEEGYARVYSSGFSNHDEWSALEEDALAEDVASGRRRTSTRSRRSATTQSRSCSFRRHGASGAPTVGAGARSRTTGWRFPPPRAPTRNSKTVASPTTTRFRWSASTRTNASHSSGLMIHEEYEEGEEFDVDTSGYGNFPFLSNLLDHLSETDGDVLVAGGRDSSTPMARSRSSAVSTTSAISRVGLRLRQINDLPETLPAEAETPRAVLVTAPARELEFDEILALREFRNDGGAVVMLGSAEASADHTENLNDLADALNTDLRFNADAVVDEEHNLADDPTVLETTAFDEAFPLFDAYDPSPHEEDEDEDEAPGNSGDAPGHQGDCPGNSGDAPPPVTAVPETAARHLEGAVPATADHRDTPETVAGHQGTPVTAAGHRNTPETAVADRPDTLVTAADRLATAVG